MFTGMIELYHFFAKYYKTIPGKISIMKLQNIEKRKITKTSLKWMGQYNVTVDNLRKSKETHPIRRGKGVNHEFTGNRNKKNRQSNRRMQ